MDENSVGVVGWLKAHSTIILIVAVGLIAGVAFLKRNPSSATTPPTSGIDTTGLQTDSNGNPIVYRDVGDTFVNVAINPVNPNDTQPVASAPPATTSGGPVEHPIEPTPTPTPTSGGGVTSGQMIATIRQRVGTAGAAQGVPVRATPDGSGSISHFLPYGSQVILNGGPVSGGNNNPVSGGSGSTTWYPVSGGYLSAYDISSISGSSTTSGGTNQSNTTTTRNVNT